VDVYERRNLTTGRPPLADIQSAAENLFARPWTSYDTVYLGLYTFNLAGIRKWVGESQTSPVITGGDTVSSATIETMLDLDLCPPYSKKRLLDERLVADLINFRSVLEQLVPFQTSLTSVGFGCFYMAFRVKVENFTALQKVMPNVQKPADAVKHFIDENARSQLAAGFNVESLDIN